MKTTVKSHSAELLLLTGLVSPLALLLLFAAVSALG